MRSGEFHHYTIPSTFQTAGPFASGCLTCVVHSHIDCELRGDHAASVLSRVPAAMDCVLRESASTVTDHQRRSDLPLH